MIFAKDFPDKLRSSILTSEVVGKKVRLKQKGKEFSGLCPFHNEKTPSFTVNDQKGFYHCFGCGAHGDVISFVMNTDGFAYPDAVQKLADDFGIPIPKIEKFDKEKDDKLTRDFLILEKTCQFFENNLYADTGIEARNYFKSRGLTGAIAKKFRLGFALNSFESLLNYLKSEGFNDQELLRSGVIGKNDRGKFYDKFRNRVIFPIINRKNQVIAFGGRTISDDMPKYLNSSETEIFKKNRTLYNVNLSRKEIFSKSYAVVVEGYMDAISLAANGVENVVAGLGTALSEQHLKELFYITDRIVICLDGDSAGIRAAKRVSEIALPLINARKNISFAILPNKMDPDDFIKEFGSKELEKNFENATPLSEILLEFALIDLKIDKNKKVSAENKAKIENILNEQLESINDSASKKYFSLFFKDALFLLGRNQKNQLSTLNSFGKKNYKSASNISDIIAKNIIALIIKFPELSNYRDNDFDIKELQFANEALTQIKESIIDAIEDIPDINEDQMINAIKDSESQKDVQDIRNLLLTLKNNDLDLNLVKFRILLLKDLSLQVDQQYKSYLSNIDEIETHHSTVTDQKIKEIFEYKNSLEKEIISLEKEII